MKNFFEIRTKSITFSAFLVGLSIFLSRVLGFIRDGLLAARFGASQELDIYFTAFRIPDFIYGILITGGVVAVFLPLFSEVRLKGKKKAILFTNNILNIFLLILITLAIFLFFLTPYLIKFIVPGFSSQAQKKTILLTRILFLSPILFGISAIFSGILQYFHFFLTYSLAPIFYNLGIIFGILFLVPKFGLIGLVGGVIFGAFLHLLIQVPSVLKTGFYWKFYFNFKDKYLKKVFHLMLPRTVGSAAYHINLIVITAIASTLSLGSITIFNLSNNLQYFPIGVVGVAFAIASFPTFSKSWAQNKKREFLQKIKETIRKILFLILPLSVLFFLMRAHIVRALVLVGEGILKMGEFRIEDIRLTAASLGIFSLGIFAQSLIPLLCRVFFSFKDTKTPVFVSLISIIINISLALLFVSVLSSHQNFLSFEIISFLDLKGISDIRVLSLPLSLSFSAIFQFFLLLFLLRRKLRKFYQKEINFLKKIEKEFFLFLEKLFFSTAIVGILAYFLLFLFQKILKVSSLFWLISQIGGVFAFSLLLFIFISDILKIKEAFLLKKIILRIFQK